MSRRASSHRGRGAAGAPDGGRYRHRKARRASPATLAAWAAVAAAAGGCLASSVVSRLSVFNASRHEVTVSVVAARGLAAYTIAACATAEFTWDGGWVVASGAESAASASAAIVLEASQGEMPHVYFEVITDGGRKEYLGTRPPSTPPCSAGSGLGRHRGKATSPAPSP